MSFLYYLVTYYLSQWTNTKPLSDAFCFTDCDARPQGRAGLGTLSEGGKSSSVPPISDIPVDITSRVLYQPWK
eukprot:CAMPEP_0176469804 /NCGR_PEP_ID=MMETSP0127-20121128/40073_1 /TAXON_ID=938130 /ORGANISM="Platyophrya macrostoma, Strain WH" /LENGTH=72 /DNA_ID=CAMNT_0017863967 /DNA_START=237 /DNA_END=455 /DNA_ORIENTATION=+